DFYEWSSQHFGLDDYYDDAEELVDHIKYIFRRDEHLLENNADYNFMTAMIARSQPINAHLA
ncbi:hypothetical protein N9X06_06260, partial [Paracoccaceae bacterium]|nr:hypothetical protein [Paracoccaceae bacterium]